MTLTSESRAPAAAGPVRARGELRSARREEWIALAAAFADHNYRHCWDYAEMLAARSGAAAEHVVVAGDAGAAGLASVRVKRVPGAGTGIAYVAGGPPLRPPGGPGARA